MHDVDLRPPPPQKTNKQQQKTHTHTPPFSIPSEKQRVWAVQDIKSFRVLGKLSGFFIVDIMGYDFTGHLLKSFNIDTYTYTYTHCLQVAIMTPEGGSLDYP